MCPQPFFLTLLLLVRKHVQSEGNWSIMMFFFFPDTGANTDLLSKLSSSLNTKRDYAYLFIQPCKFVLKYILMYLIHYIDRYAVHPVLSEDWLIPVRHDSHITQSLTLLFKTGRWVCFVSHCRTTQWFLWHGSHLLWDNDGGKPNGT